MQKRVVITGGNRGIGLDLTREFLELDYKVIVIARDFRDFEFANLVECIEFNLSEVDKLDELVKSIGVIDLLINNAGMMYGISYKEYDNAKKEKLMKLNLEAPIKLIEEFSKSMPKGSRIVNNASIAGQIGHPDIWYGMSKAALINATKSFAKIFEGNIIINAVAASPVETDMLDTIPKPRREAFLANTITKRFALSQEVAKSIFWLATDAPEYMNGTCIDINNGSYAR